MFWAKHIHSALFKKKAYCFGYLAGSSATMPAAAWVEESHRPCNLSLVCRPVSWLRMFSCAIRNEQHEVPVNNLTCVSVAQFPWF